MPSIDVILEDPSITVLGGPSDIQVQLDTGATGQRGTQTYIGAGLPSSSTIPNYSTILPGDLYINSSPGVNYAWLYQYVVKPAGNTWEPVLQLNPSLYNATYDVNFVAGEATISIPIANITTTTAILTSDNFSVTFNIEHPNPVAASLKTKTVSSGNLSLTIAAAEYDGTDWSDFVSTTCKINIAVRVISGTIVI